MRLFLPLPAACLFAQTVNAPSLFRDKLLTRIAALDQSIEGDFMKLVQDSMRKAIPAEIEVASKPGALDGVHNETGIIYVKNRSFAMAVMGTYLTEPYSPVEPVTKMVYDYFLKLAKSNQYGNLGVR